MARPSRGQVRTLQNRFRFGWKASWLFSSCYSRKGNVRIERICRGGRNWGGVEDITFELVDLALYTHVSLLFSSTRTLDEPCDTKGCIRVGGWRNRWPSVSEVKAPVFAPTPHQPNPTKNSPSGFVATRPQGMVQVEPNIRAEMRAPFWINAFPVGWPCETPCGLGGRGQPRTCHFIS